MGVKDAFLHINRENNPAMAPKERIENFCEFHEPLPYEKRKEQASRCMNCGIPYCSFGKAIEGAVIGCPLHNHCPEFNDALFKGKEELALQRLLKTNPFPEFTSRVCPALCEKACVEGLHFEAVATRENEYEIIESAFAQGLMEPRKNIGRIGKTALVIGSGPAGLACANKLNMEGFDVTVYEKNDRFGGLLMYGIPNMKLEKHIVERRIELMKAEGVAFEANRVVEEKKDAKKLLKKFDVVVLACGSEVARKLNLENEDCEGVYPAVSFLTQATKDILSKSDFAISAKDKHVVIVGGGDTGNDCVGTALRMGCSSVLQLEMMSEPPLERAADNPWPTWPRTKKTDYGQEEAIAVFGKDPRIFNTTVKTIETKDGHITGLELINLKDNTTTKVPCDILLIAAGFVAFNPALEKAFDIKSERGRAVCEDGYLHDNLYVCGDMASGQSLVVKAIASGIAVAEKIGEVFEL